MSGANKSARVGYRRAVRHARAAVSKWQARGMNPPPYLCGYCGAMIEGPTVEGFEVALLGHLREHDPDSGRKSE